MALQWLNEEIFQNTNICTIFQDGLREHLRRRVFDLRRKAPIGSVLTDVELVDFSLGTAVPQFSHARILSDERDNLVNEQVVKDSTCLAFEASYEASEGFVVILRYKLIFGLELYLLCKTCKISGPVDDDDDNDDDDDYDSLDVSSLWSQDGAFWILSLPRVGL